MEYSIQKLAQLAGVSTRTLRYYDEIDLLKPARINSSGYRIYSTHEVNLLQQILFYRELGVSLDLIKEIIGAKQFNKEKALQEHREKLLEKRNQLDQLIETIDLTIANLEGRIKMSNKDKFKGFKQQLVKNNEEQYGKEIRQKYGDEAVNQSNAKVLNMSEEEYDAITQLSNELMETLHQAFLTCDPASPLALKAADLHRQWLCYYWNSYSKEAHASLAQMYVDDERFTAYYDKEQPGLAIFLRDAILIYTGMNEIQNK